MPEQLDFLKPSTANIRHQIRNILESYNHDWDLVAELAQNSVDAITLGKPTKGFLQLEINAGQKRIVLEDNGAGISPNDLPALLAPFSSNKDGDPLLIGQKGVGVSFVIFSSSHFEIETHHEQGSARASIGGAWAWIEDQSDNLPKLQFESIKPRAEYGTKVTVTLPEETDRDFFQLTFKQLEMILRTRTAIGDTRTIWGEEADKDICLTLIDLNGESKTRRFECSYLLPTTHLGKGKYISLREFQEWNTGDKSDQQKRQKLRNKLVYHEGSVDQAGRTIKYWACFVPKRRAWDSVSVSAHLAPAELLTMSPDERIERYDDAEYLFSGGMYLSTRNMPTGIRTSLITRGAAGYLPNFFIVIEDPLLSFDIGRKSIPGRQLGMLREVGAKAFLNVLNVVRRHMGGEPEVEDDDWDRTAIFNAVRAAPDLNSEISRFLKRPSGQEATVAAIFFELLGRGALKGFKPYVCGYKNKYDLYSMYNNTDVVVEFKYALSSLFRDFDDETKLFDEVNIVVVWEITENDYAVVRSRGLDLQKIEAGLLGEASDCFHYRLGLSSTKPIRVICLKNLIESDLP